MSILSRDCIVKWKALSNWSLGIAVALQGAIFGLDLPDLLTQHVTIFIFIFGLIGRLLRDDNVEKS